MASRTGSTLCNQKITAREILTVERKTPEGTPAASPPPVILHAVATAGHHLNDDWASRMYVLATALLSDHESDHLCIAVWDAVPKAGMGEIDGSVGVDLVFIQPVSLQNKFAAAALDSLRAHPETRIPPSRFCSRKHQSFPFPSPGHENKNKNKKFSLCYFNSSEKNESGS